MSLNFELKARIADLDRLESLVKPRATAAPIVLDQVDTYFKVNFGRFKLRQSPQAGDELIYYERVSQSGIKDSRYWRKHVSDGETSREAISEACGVDTVVAKRRKVYLVENVRIHLDRVQGLGNFMEFEAVIASDSEKDRSHDLLEKLTSELQIVPKQCLAGSYRELSLEAQ